MPTVEEEDSGLWIPSRQRQLLANPAEAVGFQKPFDAWHLLLVDSRQLPTQHAGFVWISVEAPNSLHDLNRKPRYLAVDSVLRTKHYN